MVATLRGRQQMLSMEVAEGPEGPEDVTAFQRDGLVLEFSSTASEAGWQAVVPAWQVYVPTPSWSPCWSWDQAGAAAAARPAGLVGAAVGSAAGAAPPAMAACGGGTGPAVPRTGQAAQEQGPSPCIEQVVWGYLGHCAAWDIMQWSMTGGEPRTHPGTAVSALKACEALKGCQDERLLQAVTVLEEQEIISVTHEAGAASTTLSSTCEVKVHDSMAVRQRLEAAAAAKAAAAGKSAEAAAGADAAKVAEAREAIQTFHDADACLSVRMREVDLQTKEEQRTKEQVAKAVATAERSREEAESVVGVVLPYTAVMSRAAAMKVLSAVKTAQLELTLGAGEPRSDSIHV